MENENELNEGSEDEFVENEVAEDHDDQLNFEDLSNDDLFNTVEILQAETKHLDLENEIFENFLKANEPSLLLGMIKLTGKRRSITYVESMSALKRAESCNRINLETIASLLQPDKGARINLSQKTDLVLREIDEMQISLERFIKRSHRAKCNLKAEIEETSIRAEELKVARASFEQDVVIDGLNQLTQRIPAEKFVRYMQEWLKSVQFTLEKLRLRTSSLRIHYSKLKHVLAQKEELGESVHEVDFEKLRIENQHFIEKFEQKNLHLIELKRMNGKSNLILSTYKNYLQKQTEEINKYKKVIEKTKQNVVELQKEAEDAELEVVQSAEILEQITDMTANYKVPDVMEYIKAKSDLYDIKKAMKIWERRLNILKISLDTYTRKMKNITGLKRPRSSWFELKDAVYYEEFELTDDEYLSSHHDREPFIEIDFNTENATE